MDPVVPMERWPRRHGRGDSHVVQGRLIVAGLVVLLLVLLTVGVDMYTDWLWFASLGLTGVYGTILGQQVILFFAAALLFLALYLPSAYLARRLAHTFEQLSPPDEDVLWAYIARVGARMGTQSAYFTERTRLGSSVTSASAFTPLSKPAPARIAQTSAPCTWCTQQRSRSPHPIASRSRR